jgi:hypothetical protein
MLRTLQKLKTLHLRLYGGIKMTKAKKKSKDEGSIWDFITGLVIGFIGYGIISEYANRKPKCPICNTEVKHGQPKCHVCKNQFKW